MRNKSFKIDFIGIGDQKSASGWIFKALTEHPEICVSKRKETNFLIYSIRGELNIIRSFIYVVQKIRKLENIVPLIFIIRKWLYELKNIFQSAKNVFVQKYTWNKRAQKVLKNLKS